jgi:hypothetical protein
LAPERGYWGRVETDNGSKVKIRFHSTNFRHFGSLSATLIATLNSLGLNYQVMAA